jgi:hypothetical protein
MTVAAIVFSLLPVLLSKGTGMEILKPIAAPSIGGMISSSIHVLFMTPCLVVIGEDLRRSGILSRLKRLRVSSLWKRKAEAAKVHDAFRI